MESLTPSTLVSKFEFLKLFHLLIFQMRYGKPYNSLRRDSGTSDDFLTVESAIMRSNVNGGTGGIGIGGVRGANVGVIGGLLKNPGSMSSGCASDGSTDSLLEQDLHNLSLAVTQQALE